MPKEDRDETKDVGSGRRQIRKDDKGKSSNKRDAQSDVTHPPTEAELDPDKG